MKKNFIFALAAVAGLAVLGAKDASAQSCATAAPGATIDLTGPEQGKDVTSPVKYGNPDCSSFVVLVKGTAGPQLEWQAIFANDKPTTQAACEQVSVIASYYTPKTSGLGWELAGPEQTVRARWGAGGCAINTVLVDLGGPNGVGFKSMRVAARALTGTMQAKVKVYAGNRTPPQ